ncbi:secreted aspartic proteinase precursor [Amylocarpus encephaloides]|uniref:Secreted aspartic proteinase n=1 Tax=Amylocarpus encephaloides TaxID=45428 RepID=A0A9P7YML9_9HELO|nr:secreted aspartic proteinase precursor [Amylocarpus encephaloides]
MSLSFSLTAALLSLLPLISSSPIQDVQPRAALQSFAVQQVPNPKFQGYDNAGPAALLRTFYKYNVQPPAAARAMVNSTGIVAATPFPAEYDREYVAPVSLGTPAQELNLIFDTGSSDLWVFSTSMPAAQVAGQKLYNPSGSSTSAVLWGHTWSIQYGDGSRSSGTVVNELVTIGGISYASQALEIANGVSAQFSQDPASSGLLGLGFSILNTVIPTSQKTWFDNVLPTLAAPVFTVDLKRAAPGTYTFGAIDASSYAGKIEYTPIDNSNGFWRLQASGYQVGTSPFQPTTIDAIADTGTTLLMLPAAIVKAYYAQVPGSQLHASYGAYTFPCSAKLPSFTFGIGRYRGVIPGAFVSYGRIDATTCYGGIQDQGNLPFSIFGDILMKAQVVVFDAGRTRIGFAAKKV